MANDNIFNNILGSIRTSMGLKKNGDDFKSDIEEFNNPNIQKKNYIDAVNKLHADNSKEAGADKETFKTFEDLMGQKVSDMTSNPDVSRLARYQEMDFMMQNLPQVSRALQIYADNIISPDDITKQTLSIKISELLDSEKSKLLKDSVRKIINSSGIEQNVDLIVSQTLSKGDQFVEIVNLSELNLNKLSENVETKPRLVKVDTKPFKDENNEQVQQLSEVSVDINFHGMSGDSIIDEILTENTIKVDADLENLLEDAKVKSKKKDSDVINNMSNLSYKYHKPEHVIKVAKESFTFGYIIFSAGSNPRFPGGNEQSTSLYTGGEAKLHIGDEIIRGVFDTIRTAITNKNKDLETNDSEMYNIIAKVLYDSNQSLKARFVKTSHMVHFKLPGRFNEYGEPIFYNVRQTARMYTITLYAVTIHRLTRSMEKRVFNVEIGDSIDAAGLIQGFKKSIKQKSIVFSNDLTIDNIPDMMSMFEDYYIPQRDGTPFVTIDTIQGQDINSRLEELEFLRKQMLVGIGVPPILLGYDQDSNYTTTLSQENAMFAQTVVRLQKHFAAGFTELASKVYAITNLSDVEFDGNVNIILQPPKILQVQRDSELISNLQSIKDVLEDFDIPKAYIIKKYFSGYIDFDEIEKIKQDELVKDNLTKPSGGEGDEEEPGF